MAEVEDTVGAPPTTTTTESEGTTTDDEHLSPTCACGGRGRRGGRIKILCSFGGRIVPRPHDGALKYVGGETRVLAVPRSIPFREMKKKVEEMFKTEVAAIKYQLLSLAEDLDVLVSVTCDEDLVHMLEEYDRFEAKRSPTASPRFRVYIFAPQPAAPLLSAAAPARQAGLSRLHPQHHHQHHHFQPERYVATVPVSPDGSPPFPAQPHGAVSAGNSPRANAVYGAEPPAVFGLGMQRVRSSPNLGALDAAAQHLHQHAADGGGGGRVPGCVGGSPSHAGGAGHHLLHSNSFHQYQYQHQYAPAPAPAPAPHHAGRYDARGYVRVGNYLAPMAPPSRPVSRGGLAPHSEMVTPKKSAIVWD
ncbi:one cut domain family member 2-like [Panicum miliaceum]|uniref:One cut domain family member 2-like n=1 Tax=Panicum miliaceum TaxID=4540 RepID=A0A3L6R832_PANMI|nr:one cut domain family member 2-like [Panicum miliaceum]